MEKRENELIAQKLNSLQTLPEGYTPNLSSKWEIVQAAMEKRSHRSRKRTVAVLLFLAIAAAVAIGRLNTSRRAIEEAPKTSVIKPPVADQLPKAFVPPPVEPLPLKSKRVKKIRPENALPAGAKKDSVPPPPPTVQQPATLTDTLQQRRDTLKAVVPVARLKAKARVYQRDFEGITTSTDTVNTKTAAKGFLRFNLHKAEESPHDWKPALRIHQNF